MSILHGMEEPRKSWRHEEGDKIAVVVTERDEGEDYEGDGTYPIVIGSTIEGTENGGQPIPAGEERAIHAFHLVLRRQIERKDPQEGDVFAVADLGYPTDKRYCDYRVRIQRRSRGTGGDASETPSPESPVPPDEHSNLARVDSARPQEGGEEEVPF